MPEPTQPEQDGKIAGKLGAGGWCLLLCVCGGGGRGG